MPLSIKDPETDRLARDLARRTGESITVATRKALQERLRRVRGAERKVPSSGGPRGYPAPMRRTSRARSEDTGRNHRL
jgi:hypothetical protein